MAVNHSTARSGRESSEARYAAPALEKGLDILELLAARETGMTQRQIADALERSTSEIFRMLACLERRGYIRRDLPEELYYLSARLFVLAHHHPPTQRLHDAALPIMRRLARQTSQSCHLSVVHSGQLLTLVQVDAPGAMGFVVRPGTCAPLHETSSGTLLLAFADRTTREQWLSEAPVPASAAVHKSLERRYPQIRQRGYELRPSQTVKGITDVAAPVLDVNCQAIAAVTVPYLASLPETQTITQVRQSTLDAARELSILVGGSN